MFVAWSWSLNDLDMDQCWPNTALFFSSLGRRSPWQTLPEYLVNFCLVTWVLVSQHVVQRFIYPPRSRQHMTSSLLTLSFPVRQSVCQCQAAGNSSWGKALITKKDKNIFKTITFFFTSFLSRNNTLDLNRFSPFLGILFTKTNKQILITHLAFVFVLNHIPLSIFPKTSGEFRLRSAEHVAAALLTQSPLPDLQAAAPSWKEDMS